MKCLESAVLNAKIHKQSAGSSGADAAASAVCPSSEPLPNPEY